MYRVQLSKDAVKFYKKSEISIKRQLNECFKSLEENPNKNQNIKKLHGELDGLYRYRVGSIRVIYKINNEQIIVYVVTIGNRGDVYK